MATAVPLLRREPGCNNATVARERRRFRQTNQETKRKEGDNNAETTKDIDKTLQQGED